MSLRIYRVIGYLLQLSIRATPVAILRIVAKLFQISRVNSRPVYVLKLRYGTIVLFPPLTWTPSTWYRRPGNGTEKDFVLAKMYLVTSVSIRQSTELSLHITQHVV